MTFGYNRKLKAQVGWELQGGPSLRGGIGIYIWLRR
jgi:hypothetical protein